MLTLLYSVAVLLSLNCLLGMRDLATDQGTLPSEHKGNRLRRLESRLLGFQVYKLVLAGCPFFVSKVFFLIK
jgi:hypothetical protein